MGETKEKLRNSSIFSKRFHFGSIQTGTTCRIWMFFFIFKRGKTPSSILDQTKCHFVLPSSPSLQNLSIPPLYSMSKRDLEKSLMREKEQPKHPTTTLINYRAFKTLPLFTTTTTSTKNRKLHWETHEADDPHDFTIGTTIPNDRWIQLTIIKGKV